MSASVIVSEAMVMNPTNSTSTKIEQSVVQTQVEFASCDCCELTEEYTQAYIQMIRERYQGKWICGLCAEAVKYEMRVRNKEQDEALILHMSFCNKFKSSSPPPNPAVHLISAIRSILSRRRRSLDSPRSSRSAGSRVPHVSPIDLEESPSRTSTQDQKI